MWGGQLAGVFSNVIQTGTNVIQTVQKEMATRLNELDAEMSPEVEVEPEDVQPALSCSEELDIYKTLLEEAQMQHVQLTKVYQSLVMEKDAEIRGWKEKYAEAAGVTAEDVELEIITDDPVTLKAERDALQKNLTDAEEKIRELHRLNNDKQVVLTSYEQKIQDLSETNSALNRKIKSLEESVRDFSVQRASYEMKERSSQEALEQMANEYSCLVADGLITQQTDANRIKDLQRQNEQLRLKQMTLEQTLAELADQAAQRSQTGGQVSGENSTSNPSDAQTQQISAQYELKMKELNGKIILLEYELGEKARDAEQSVRDLARMSREVETKTREATDTTRQIAETELEVDRLKLELQQLALNIRNKDDELRAASTKVRSLQQQLTDAHDHATNTSSTEEQITQRTEALEKMYLQEIEDTKLSIQAEADRRIALMKQSIDSLEAEKVAALTNLRHDLEKEKSTAIEQTRLALEAEKNALMAEQEEKIRVIEIKEQETVKTLALVQAERERAEQAWRAAELANNLRAAEQLRIALEECEQLHTQTLQSTVEELRRTLMDERTRSLETAHAHARSELEKQKEDYQQQIHFFSSQKELLEQELQALNTRFEGKIREAVVAAEAKKDQEKMAALSILREQLEKQISAAVIEMEEYKALYMKENKLRKTIHNKLLEIQGNIRVVCRARPMVEVEMREGGGINVVDFPTPEDVIVRRDEVTKSRFEFDRTFAPSSTQVEVFEQVQPLVVSCMDGFNICIFAYGQTGSGKTFTMEGPPDNRGVSHRAIAELFAQRDARQEEWEFTFVFSMLEIYNETIRDLLSVENDRKLDIRHTAQGNSVPGLTEVAVSTVEEVVGLMETGQSNRAVGSHDMNEHSSRSHSLLTIFCRGRNIKTGHTSFGKLNLIDLAGSERVSKTDASGERLKEAQAINRSLFALGDVINALSKGSPHIPFRNSKLTFLLQDSLSGNSKVMMFVNISPASYNLGETLCSLNFAARCRNVELGQVKRQMDSGESSEAKAAPAGATRSAKEGSKIAAKRTPPPARLPIPADDVASDRSPSPTGSVTSNSSSIAPSRVRISTDRLAKPSIKSKK